MEQEQTLDFPSAVFSRQYGFSIDFGASLMKVVYVTNHGDTSRLHFKTFPHEELQGALYFIKEKVGRHIVSSRRLFLTGILVHVHYDLIQEAFGAELEVMIESDCLVDGFRFLTNHMPVSEMSYANTDTAREFGETVSKQFDEFVSVWQEASDKLQPWKHTPEVREIEGYGHQDITYPIMLFLAGSHGVPLIIQKDGKYTFIDVHTNCGKMYFGLGSMLTEAKSFDELEELARTGSATNVDVTMSQMVQPSSEESEDMYAAGSEVGLTAYSFGHAILKRAGDFSRADLAAATVASVAQSIVSPCVWACMYYGIRQIYFCGSLANGSAAFREEVSKLMEFKRRINPEGYTLDYYFLRHGAYLCAIGALLNNMNQPDVSKL